MPRAEIAVHAAFGHGFPPAAFVECFRLLKYFQFLHGDSRRETFPSASFPQGPRGACTHSFNLQLYTLWEGIRRRVRFGIMGCFHVTEFHGGGLPFLRPFLRQGEQGKRSGLRCFVLPDSQQYSISALP